MDRTLRRLFGFRILVSITCPFAGTPGHTSDLRRVSLSLLRWTLEVDAYKESFRAVIANVTASPKQRGEMLRAGGSLIPRMFAVVVHLARKGHGNAKPGDGDRGRGR